MKVLVIFTFGYSLKTWHETGTLERELSIYKELTEKNIEFVFLTYGNSDEHILLKNYNNMSVLPVYKDKNESKFRVVNLFRSFLLPFFIKKQSINFDLIKHNQLLGSWVGIITKFLIKKPLFIRTGYDMYLFSLHENKKKYIKILYKLLTQISIWFADLYTISNESDLKVMKEIFYGSKSILIRQNWTTNTHYSEFVDRTSNRILSVGRLESQKNFEYLINNFADSEFVIDIVGTGTEKNNLIELSKQNKVEVNIIERMENSDLNNLYKNYRYFVTTAKYEGNPKTVLEAMSNGCIVFASNIPNHEELIQNGKNGFIFDLQANKLKESFISNTNDLDKLVKISKSAFTYIEQNNSLKKISETEIKDYSLLIE
mgnify:CR=1 FL=1